MDHILRAATFLSRPTSASAGYATTQTVVRRVKRLIWFGLVACVALVGALGSTQDLVEQVSERLALAVILVASWAIVTQVTAYVRAEDSRRAAESEAARLEGARMTASAMQDRIANKLSLTVGYAEFLVSDPRLPDDLREQAQRAMNGACAAAEQMSELKRLTRQDYETCLHVSGAAPAQPGAYDSDLLFRLLGRSSGERA